jgi:mono/diheme cytochrome c family protein
VKVRIPIHLKAILILLVAIVIFSVVVPMVSAAIPGQLYGWYIFATLGAIFLYISSTEASWREFTAPFRALLLGRTALTKPLRFAVFIIVPLLCGWYFSSWASDTVSPPGGLRVIHPTPPGSVNFKGKRMTLKDIPTNPLRADTAHMDENTAEGRRIYFENCFYCHGDKLDGQGHFAKGFNPPPANFQDSGTIAQLTESFLFWRIAKGGPGLPGESAPWDSAMPAWESYLNEKEIWQVILYLYSAVPYEPRTWGGEDHGGGGH